MFGLNRLQERSTSTQIRRLYAHATLGDQVLHARAAPAGHSPVQYVTTVQTLLVHEITSPGEHLDDLATFPLARQHDGRDAEVSTYVSVSTVRGQELNQLCVARECGVVKRVVAELVWYAYVTVGSE